MKPEIKRLPKSLRLGGTRLYKNWPTGETAQPDGVRRINSRAVELETYANWHQRGASGALAISIIVTIALLPVIFYIYGIERLTLETTIKIILSAATLPMMAAIFYFAGGTHRTRGAYIRIHRLTRKVYIVFPGQTRLHTLDWDHLEVLAGYIPIVTQTGLITRHPLYLIGVDYSMHPPTEICAACGNLGVFDGDRSAKSLFSYLQTFMEHGPERLPKPPPIAPRLSRRAEALQPYRDWYTGLRRTLAKPYGLLKAPITIPLWLGWLLINAYPDSFENFIQYNVPYSKFPKEIDTLCGFHEKRKPVIRVNGKRIDS
ncbi:hypothetical protein [Pseudomonas cremoricolorata]|uniref:hypothetical protein n=1 Tax=Pseudomonas cremoricolorata TaxID=157783 RepID=UPI0012B6582E|nr:hypothetical protein [Pseudomonas cremoricolorata]